MSYCRSCNQPYHLTSNIPRLLSCGHNYCSNCLITVCQQQGYFDCLVCRHRSFQAEVQASQIDEDFIITLAELARVKLQLYQIKGEVKGQQQSSPTKGPISPEEKCQYEPCKNKKQVIEGEMQLFCSNECKIKWKKDTMVM